MNFVIPMAGEGKRFKEAGYDVPKYLINSKGRSLLEWSLCGLPLELASRLIFIFLSDHEQHYDVSNIIRSTYGEHADKMRFCQIDSVTRGQAETVYKSKDLMSENEPLLIFNIDTFFKSDSLVTNLNRSGIDGVIGSFLSQETRFSFASVGENGFVTETAEKIPISEFALTGLYHFSKTADFLETAEYHFNHNITFKNEYYIAPMYNYLIQRGRKYILDFAVEHHILGTPEELDRFNQL